MSGFSPRPFEKRHTTGPGCWEWLDSLGSHGYGQLMVAGVPWTAHRYSWTLANGPIPAGQHVLHTCDNRRCVRPDHLYLGTERQNAADRKARGQAVGGGAKGERQWNATLTADAVRDIRQRRISGETLASIAARHGITLQQVHRIATRKSWRHIE